MSGGIQCNVKGSLLDIFVGLPYNVREVIKMRDIGKNIRQLRVQKNMTQEEFAEKLYVTRQTVSNYENGRSRPDIDMLETIANVLETDVNALLYGPSGLNGKKSYKRLLTAGGILAGLFAVYALIPYLLRSENPYTDITVRYFDKVTLLPLIMTVFGWLTMQVLGDFCSLRPWTGKGSLTVRYAAAVLIGLILLIPIPYCVWLGGRGIPLFVPGFCEYGVSCHPRVQ